MDVPEDAVARILMSLGFEMPKTHYLGPRSKRGTWSRRHGVVDMHRQVDLIEEVGRHHGFEHLPSTFPGVEQAPPPSDPRIARDRRARTALLALGFSEAISFAFIAAKAPSRSSMARNRWRSRIRCRSSSRR
jgi:phenylalanyl-tRNA synthetase beta chain